MFLPAESGRAVIMVKVTLCDFEVIKMPYFYPVFLGHSLMESSLCAVRKATWKGHMVGVLVDSSS